MKGCQASGLNGVLPRRLQNRNAAVQRVTKDIQFALAQLNNSSSVVVTAFDNHAIP